MSTKLKNGLPCGTMFNAYPDSCGGTLAGIVSLLSRDDFADAFSLFYILPSLFRSDLDRGFSVITYDLEQDLATISDLQSLRNSGIKLKLDFVLNHLSMQSPQFRDLLEKGDASQYESMFIDWNRFWEGEGTLSDEGFIVPHEGHLSKLFMRKPGLPILRVPFPDGSSRFYWNTFYQDVSIEVPSPDVLLTVDGVDRSIVDAVRGAVQEAAEANASVSAAVTRALSGRQATEDIAADVASLIDREYTSYKGQMDLNAESDRVWRFYEDTLRKLASYGAEIVRLDAFAYLHKEVGSSNFFNEPGTWEYLDRIHGYAQEHSLTLLPEIHSAYSDGTYRKLSDHGFPIYDFFFPVLAIHAIETGESDYLVRWIREVIDQNYRTVTMLGCHDGIPVLDVKGLLDDGSIDWVIELILDRGGRLKDLYGPDGKKIAYYQVNATFFSALGESVDKLLLARALHLFMPGTPQIWYLDLFAGKNDIDAADTLGHKDINRTNLSTDEIERRLPLPVTRKQLSMIRFRNTYPAFEPGSTVRVAEVAGGIELTWSSGEYQTTLTADLSSCEFEIRYIAEGGQEAHLALGD